MTTIDYTEPYMCAELGCDVVDVMATPACGMPTMRVARVMTPTFANPRLAFDGPIGIGVLTRIVADVVAGRHVNRCADDA